MSYKPYEVLATPLESHPFHHSTRAVHFVVHVDSVDLQCGINQYKDQIHIFITETGALTSHIFVKDEKAHRAPTDDPIFTISTIQGPSYPHYNLLAHELGDLLKTSGKSILLSLSLRKCLGIEGANAPQPDDDVEGTYEISDEQLKLLKEIHQQIALKIG